MKKKRRISVMIAAVLACTLLSACGGSQPAASTAAATGASGSGNTGSAAVGTLSLLNMTEEEYHTLLNTRQTAWEYLKAQGVLKTTGSSDSMPAGAEVKFYDTLDAMIMALESGDVSMAELPKCTADYLCAHNDKLEEKRYYDMNKADDFAKKVINRMGVGYSFMMKDDKTALRDEFDKAISDMKSDGTLNKLIKNYINEGVFTEQKEVEFNNTYGDTLKIAVTGSLPPMDFVAPDGKFAGFNTAILAELGNRLKKNIELVQVDSMGRAAALSSGRVDVVFWTSGANEADAGSRLTNEEHEKFVEEKRKNGTEEHSRIMKSISEGMSYEKTEKKDQPDGTIITAPYYSDVLVLVGRKG